MTPLLVLAQARGGTQTNGFLHCIIFIALIILISVGVVVYKESQGAEFSKGDIIFIAVVIGACVLAIAITILCHLVCRRKTNKDIEDGSWMSLFLCNDTINSKLKVKNKDFTGSDCAICLEEKDDKKQVVEITCNHTYHRACITKCMEVDRPAKCPQCRRNPKTYPLSERLVALVRGIMNKRRAKKQNLAITEDPAIREKLNNSDESSSSSSSSPLPTDEMLPEVVIHDI